ncbi:MAG: hypothetical protein ABSA33_01280 [Candidatus Micrarchaeaceae archaeon]
MEIKRNKEGTLTPQDVDELATFVRGIDSRKQPINSRVGVTSKKQLSVRIIEKNANFEDSKMIATQNNGRLLTLKEFIMKLKEPDFYEKTKGFRYWLGNEPGLKISGNCKIDYEKGTIEPVSESVWKTLPLEQKAYAWSGNHPLDLDVGSGDAVRRLVVDASDGPGDVAPRVAVVVAEPGLPVLRL